MTDNYVSDGHDKTVRLGEWLCSLITEERILSRAGSLPPMLQAAVFATAPAIVSFLHRRIRSWALEINDDQLEQGLRDLADFHAELLEAWSSTEDMERLVAAMTPPWGDQRC